MNIKEACWVLIGNLNKRNTRVMYFIGSSPPSGLVVFDINSQTVLRTDSYSKQFNCRPNVPSQVLGGIALSAVPHLFVCLFFCLLVAYMELPILFTSYYQT